MGERVFTSQELEAAIEAAERRGYVRGYSVGRAEGSPRTVVVEERPYYATGQPCPPVIPDGAWASDYPVHR